MPKRLLEPDYQAELKKCNDIIAGAKQTEGLSNVKQWQGVVDWINQKIEGLARNRKNILLGVNQNIPTDRELTEVKGIEKQIQAFEEIRDIEKSFTEDVNKALEKKKNLEEIIEKQKAPRPKRTHTY